MKISIIGPAYPLRGGISHHIFWLRKDLIARSHTVQVVSFRKLYPRLFFPGTSELDTSDLKLDAGAVSILTPLNPATWLSAFRQIRAFSPDWVIFEWWQPFFGPLVGTLARWLRRTGVRCIIECHNVFPHERSPLDGMLLRYGISAADYLIAHSAKDQADLISLFPRKQITVAPLPELDEFLAQSNSSRSGRTILFFGKVRKYKGLEVLLAAMPAVLSKLDCKLVIVGEFYDSIEKYEQLIRRHGIESQVQIDNRYVPNEEVPAVFERAAVLVLPYVSASQSGVARIALSNNLPVIASRTGGLSETVIDGLNGLLFPPGDSDALAKQVVRYFLENLGPTFSENIRKTRQKDAHRQLGDVIEEICRS
ncbi:MAG TPA: glycosyltransferase [Blastocatellia bacterium]|nr:glycosyltransferase [Blastocatellia bacterium]